MNRLIKLINEKNHYLEKFLTLNEQECQRLQIGNYDNLDNFYETREQILGIIKYIDSEMSNLGSQMDQAQVTEEDRRELQAAMHTKDEYVSRILDQDLEVLSAIEKAKTQIIQDLRGVNKNRKALRGYKSRNRREGGLNEEI